MSLLATKLFLRFSNEGRWQVNKVTHCHVRIVHATSFALVAAIRKMLLQQALQGNQWSYYLVILVVGSKYWQLSVPCWVERQDAPVVSPKGSVSIDTHSTRATRILKALENGSIYGCCIFSIVVITTVVCWTSKKE